MRPEKHFLKQRETQCDPFQRFNADVFEPAKQRRPCTGACARADILRKTRPMLSRQPVMLHVIAVIEEQDVVEETIVTRGSVDVLEVTVQKTQAKTECITGEIDKQKETGGGVQQESPQREHRTKLNGYGC